MRRNAVRGMTLVELLVAMVIGLGVTLAVATLLVAAENHKRTTTSTNDADQTGTYAFHALDRAIRSAGSAIIESAYPTDRGILGCTLNVTSILPRASAFPAPFSANFLAGATATLAVAPVLIGKAMSDDGKSDVIAIMGGSGAAGGVSRPEFGTGSATSLVLGNTVGFSPNDLVLLSQPGVTDCLLEEVGASASAITTTTLAIGGTTYLTSTGTTTTLASLAANTASYVTPIGNATANNVQFQLFGVGTNNILYSYDLLQNARLVQGLGGDTSQPITDGVVQMNAIYGIASTANTAVIGDWRAPTLTTPSVGYDISSVMTSQAKMEGILAVRVALVVRGEYYDKQVVSPTSLTIFSGYTDTASGASLAQTVTVPDTHYRYRVFEFTIPLRNTLILAQAATGGGG